MSLLLKRALDWAAVLHQQQHRKYPGVHVPYVSHCAGVAVTLARHGFDDEVVAAGALHDAMEDCGVTFEELEARFGRRVASLVNDCSEQDKSRSWDERKALYLAAFVSKPWDAQAITLADKIDNFRSIAVCRQDYGDPWAMFKKGRASQMERFEQLRAMTEALAPHPLIEEFVEALALLHRVS
jgi:(p)ppGpp synthase/HD superfamily hydrolase